MNEALIQEWYRQQRAAIDALYEAHRAVAQATHDLAISNAVLIAVSNEEENRRRLEVYKNAARQLQDDIAVAREAILEKHRQLERDRVSYLRDLLEAKEAQDE